MIFYMQANNPKCQGALDFNNTFLSEAIEDIFPLYTENAIMSWNYISIPLSYKYDISYMIDDIVKLLNVLRNKKSGKYIVNWLPDTFRCNWSICWKEGEMEIDSMWECTVGDLENILNNRNKIIISVAAFSAEWKKILEVIIKNLEMCGYNKNNLNGMRELVEEYNNIIETGILYRF